MTFLCFSTCSWIFLFTLCAVTSPGELFDLSVLVKLSSELSTQNSRHSTPSTNLQQLRLPQATHSLSCFKTGQQSPHPHLVNSSDLWFISSSLSALLEYVPADLSMFEFTEQLSFYTNDNYLFCIEKDFTCQFKICAVWACEPLPAVRRACICRNPPVQLHVVSPSSFSCLFFCLHRFLKRRFVLYGE